ncbi:MAG: transmembrane sensor/regulator PpyR [Kangiellaceae bacterium]
MTNEQLYLTANVIIAISFSLIGAGIFVGFVEHLTFTIPQQVLAHISIMLGAGFLKLSYVMRLNASKHLGINDFAPLEIEMPNEMEV